MRLSVIKRFRGGSGVSWPGLAVLFVVVLCALSVLVSALVPASGGAQGQQDSLSPQLSQQDGDFRVFEFGSMEDRGEYVHCVSFVSPDEQDPSQLLPSDEICYKQEPEISDIDAIRSGAATAQSSSRSVILGKHYDYFNYQGPSLTVVGKGTCAGGGITLTGGRWDNRIASTRNGCSTIEHYTYSRPFVFSGTKQSTYGYGGNLNLVGNQVSGILYKGFLQAPPIRPTTTPPTTATPPPPPPPLPPRPPSRPQPVSNHNVAVTVEAIEVTQGVQDWNNSVRLVRGRPTVVRVFLEADSRNADNAVDVSANLVVSVVGSRGTQTLTATNEGGQVAVSSDVNSRRGHLDSSLNFVLPETWTNRTSTERLRLTLAFRSGITSTCSSSAATDFQADAQQVSVTGNCSRDVSFVDVTEPFIFFIPFEIVGNETCDINSRNVEGTSLGTVTRAQIEEQAGRIFSNMPFSQNLNFNAINDYHIHTHSRIANTCDLTNILNLLQNRRTYEVGLYANDPRLPYPIFYVGILPCGWELPDDGIAGRAIPSRRVAAWTMHSIDGTCTEGSGYSGYIRNTGSHELGHLLGQPHPARESVFGTFFGACGGRASAISNFNFFSGIDINDDGNVLDGRTNFLETQGDNIDNTRRRYSAALRGDEFFATLGPIADRNIMTDVWGFDVRLFQLFLQGGNFENSMIISDPREVFSLMSYCRVNTGNNQWRWMDSFHHNEIINDRLTRSSSSADLDATQSSQTLVNSEIISGVLDLSSGSPVSVSLNPVHSRTTRNQTNSSGDYKLELLGSSDSVLRSIPFDVGEIEITCETGPCPASAQSNKALFGLVINSPPDYKKLRFSKSGTTFATITRSANKPLLQGHIISFLELTARLPSEDVTLSWSATDADNDNLKYTVFYSTDSGKTYSVLLMNTDVTSYTINPDSVAGSNTARVAVSVSDGLRTDFKQSEIFAITDKPPDAGILSLGAHDISAGGNISDRQSLVLSARGYDKEDGNLPSVAFSWRSSIDGDLGTGRFIVVSGADLTAGEHEITMTATDSAGNQVTDRTYITISAYQILPEAIDDSASASLDDAVFVDVVANDINIDPDAARSSLSITKAPALGTASIAVSPGGLRSVKYTGHTSGTDTVGYRICDETDASNCSEATLSISVAIGSCTIIGTEGDDILEGTTGDDVICGMGGDDRIDGKRGNDVIYGGSGDDTLYGRDGDDTIYGGSGDDLILGHRGDDVLYGRLGDDRIYAGGGDDIATGGKGSDRLHGEADDDTLEGNQGNDVIHGGRGNDTIIGGPGDDTIRGNAGTDTIYLGEGTDTLLGTSPQDNVIN